MVCIPIGTHNYSSTSWNGYSSTMDRRDPPNVDGRTLRHQHRRPEILAAASEYVLDHGIFNLSLRPMAAALGVTHATLLRHFGSKEALVAETIDSITTDLFEQLAAEFGDLETAKTFDLVCAAWREFCKPHQRRQFLLLFELVSIDARDRGRYGDLRQSVIADYLRPLERNLRANGRTPAQARDMATAILAMVHGLHLDLAVCGDLTRVDRAFRRFVRMMTDAPSGRD